MKLNMHHVHGKKAFFSFPHTYVLYGISIFKKVRWDFRSVADYVFHLIFRFWWPVFPPIKTRNKLKVVSQKCVVEKLLLTMALDIMARQSCRPRRHIASSSASFVPAPAWASTAWEQLALLSSHKHNTMRLNPLMYSDNVQLEALCQLSDWGGAQLEMPVLVPVWRLQEDLTSVSEFLEATCKWVCQRS